MTLSVMFQHQALMDATIGVCIVYSYLTKDLPFTQQGST